MWVLLSLLALVAAPAQGQELKKPELKAKVVGFQTQTRGFVYPSGLRVLLQQDRSAPIVTVVEVHSGGTTWGPPDKTGTAHLAEHLAFRSPIDGVPARDLLNANGVNYDAATTTAWTIFRFTGSTPSLATILKAAGAQMADPFVKIAPAALEEERTILQLEPFYRVEGWNPAWPTLQQLTTPSDDPEAALDWQTLYTGASSITREDLDAYAAKGWSPSETTLLIHGDIDFDAVTALLFETLPPTAIHPKATAENVQRFIKPGIVNADPNNPDHTTTWFINPDTDAPIALSDPEEPRQRLATDAPVPRPRNDAYEDVVHITGRTDQRWAVVAWQVPGAWIGQDAIASIGAGALNQGGWADWQEQFDIAKGPLGNAIASCGWYFNVRHGWVICTAKARDERSNADEIADRLMAASARFWNADVVGMQEANAVRGQQNALSNLVQSFDDLTEMSTGRVTRAALSAHFQGDPGYAMELTGEIMSLDWHDTPSWVRDWLPESRAVQIVVDPIPREQWISLLPQGKYHATVTPPTVPETDTPPTNETIAAAYSAPDLGQVKQKVLPNGLRVLAYRHGEAPLALNALVSRGGAGDGNGMDTIADITMRRLTQEINEDPTGMKKALEPVNIAGAWVFSRDAYLTFEGISAPPGNVDGAQYLLRRNDMARKVNLAARPNWWKAVKLQLPNTWYDKSWWARRERLDRIMPGHPITWEMGREDALRLNSVSTGEILAWQARKFNPTNSTMIIAGSVDPDEAIAQAETYWADWKPPSTETVEDLPPMPAPTGAGVLLFDGTGASNTIISATCQLAEPDVTHAPAQAVLGSLASERLGAELLEAGAGALASTGVINNPAPIAWLDLTVVLPHDKVGQGVDAVRATLEAIKAGDFDAARTQTFKLQVAGQTAMNVSSTRAVVDAIARAMLVQGRGPDWYDKFRDNLVAVDSAALAASAASCADNAVITVEGPIDTLRAHASKWNAEEIDWLARADAELMAWDKGAYKKKLKQRAKAGN